MSARLRCNLCKRLVLGGGHPCLGGANDGTGMREEHLAECAVCETFHEPHCPPKESSRKPSEVPSCASTRRGEPDCDGQAEWTDPHGLGWCAVHADVERLMPVALKSALAFCNHDGWKGTVAHHRMALAFAEFGAELLRVVRDGDDAGRKAVVR